MSVAKSLALSTGQTLDASREFVGQGLASLASGLTQGIPPSGSLSRSTVNFSSGARTRMAGAFSGVFVLLALLTFAPWLGNIPMAGLAGVVIVAAIKMIDVEHIAIIHVEGALYFGATDDLEARLDTLFRSGVKVAILRLRRVRLLGSTGVTVFERIAASAKRRGTRVTLCGVREEVAQALQVSGVSAFFGAENIFKADDALFESTYAALRRAKETLVM